MSKLSSIWAPLAILVMAALVRGLFFIYAPLLDADMAGMGLLGLQVARGELPVFFLGQPYAGMLEAYAAAPLLLLFGTSTRALSLAPTLISLLFVWLNYIVIRDMWGRRAGLMAMLLAAVPPYYFMWHNVLPRGCYIEIPLLSLLLVWLAFRLTHRTPNWRLYFAYGLVAGLGFWTHFLISYALMATAIYLLIHDWRMVFRLTLLIVSAGFIAGSLPLLTYNINHEWSTFTYLLGLKKSMGFLPAFSDFVFQAWPTLVGSFWDGTKDAIFPVISQAMWALSAAILVYIVWQRRNGLTQLARLSTNEANGAEIWLLFLVVAVLITSIKGEPVGSSRRHFVPMYAAMIPLAAYACKDLYEKHRRLGLTLLVMLLAFNLGGILINSPVGNAKLRRNVVEQVNQRRNFIEALLNQGITRAYGLDYWVCTPITFESDERVIVVMGNEDLDHYYEPHSRLVAQAPSPAWVGRRDSHFLEAALRNLGATFQRLRVGEYTAFYDIKAPQRGFVEVPPRTWRAISGDHIQDGVQAWDRDALTRWSPLAPQRPGQSLVLDLGQEIPDLCLVRISPGRIDDFPEGLSVYTSRDGQDWQRVVKAQLRMAPLFWWEGKALTSHGNYRADLYFKPRPTRYLRFVQTMSNPIFYWSVQELHLFRPAPELTPANPMALLELAARNQARALYADVGLEAFAPIHLFPPALPPPHTPAWPLEIKPRDVLPGDPSRSMVAVDQATGPELLRCLTQQGYIYQQAKLGGFQAVWDLKPPPLPGRQLAAGGFSLTSSNPGRESAAIDGDPQTRWDSGQPRRTEDYYQLDMGTARHLVGLSLEARPAPLDLPEDLLLELSEDGITWRGVEYARRVSGPLVFGGDGLLTAYQGRVELVFPAQQARFLRLKPAQGHPRYYWSIYEISVWEKEPSD